MKRIVTLFLAFVMLLSFVACSELTANKSNDANANGNGTSNGNNTTKTANNDGQIPALQDESAKGEEKAENVITFSETVAIDNENCAIKITEIDDDIIWGYTVKALLENKSSDKTYMFSVESAAINGVQCDPFFASEVSAGKKSNEEIHFSSDKLDKNGITEYTDIELTFRVYDSNDWSADDVSKETIHIYPYGKDKAVKFVREAQPSDNVIIDNDYVTVIVTGYEQDEIFGYMVNLFLLNKTDKNIMFSVDEASVNGFMADPFYADSVLAGKCAFSSMAWSDTTLEENGITEVETIEFKLRAYDEDNWFDGDFANETITLNP